MIRSTAEHWEIRRTVKVVHEREIKWGNDGSPQ